MGVIHDAEERDGNGRRRGDACDAYFQTKEEEEEDKIEIKDEAKGITLSNTLFFIC